MPSFCVIDSCKRVKQPGDPISFHKFPFHSPNLVEQWVGFVQKHSKHNTVKNITKYSSVCSQHFKDSDFNPNGITTRKFLKKSAVPSVQASANGVESTKGHDRIVLIEDEHIVYESCALCKTHYRATQLHLFDEYNFTLIRKCIPFVNFSINFMQKICIDCLSILNTFSSFIDKVLIAQNLVNQETVPQQSDPLHEGIKTEPLPDEIPAINFIKPINFNNSPKIQKPANQKKLEILEIVDIKPLNFLPYETNALSSEVSETYDEGECQILSPHQLKVEIAEDGENELENIKKYMHITSVYHHDHNYVLENQEINIRNVKTEFEVQEIELPITTELEEIKFIPICCKKKFSSFRKYLLHKITRHKKPRCCKVCSKVFPNEVSLNHHRKYSCKKSTAKKLYKKVLAKLKPQEDKIKRRKSYACPICKKLFKGPKNLYQHKLSHRQSQLSCAICMKLFKRRHGLRQHIIAQHEKKKFYHCPVCNHPYALKGDIKRCKHSDLRKKK